MTFFGCGHRSLSRVFTPPRHPENSYVKCWDCGKEFAYDLEAMRVRGEIVPGDPPRTWQDSISVVGQ